MPTNFLLGHGERSDTEDRASADQSEQSPSLFIRRGPVGELALAAESRPRCDELDDLPSNATVRRTKRRDSHASSGISRQIVLPRRPACGSQPNGGREPGSLHFTREMDAARTSRCSAYGRDIRCRDCRASFRDWSRAGDQMDRDLSGRRGPEEDRRSSRLLVGRAACGKPDRGDGRFFGRSSCTQTPFPTPILSLRGFGKYLGDLGISVDLDERLYAEGLCFLPLRASKSEIIEVAKFSFLRVARRDATASSRYKGSAWQAANCLRPANGRPDQQYAKSGGL